MIIKLDYKGRLAIARVISRNYLDGNFNWTVDILGKRVTFTDVELDRYRRG